MSWVAYGLDRRDEPAVERQHPERGQQAGRRHDQRHDRGDDRPERDQQDQEGQRQRQAERRVETAVDELLDLLVGEVVVQDMDGEVRVVGPELGHQAVQRDEVGGDDLVLPRHVGGDPGRRPVRRDQLRLGRRGQRIDELLERGDGGAVDGRLEVAQSRHDVGDGGLGRRIVDRAVVHADDHEHLLAGVGAPARAEEVVGPRRLEPGRLVVRDRGGGVRPARGDARDEDPERRDEPQEEDRPAMAGAPAGDADGPGRPGDGLGSGRGAAWCLTRRVAYRAAVIPVSGYRLRGSDARPGPSSRRACRRRYGRSGDRRTSPSN